METINITVNCNKKPDAPIMENIVVNILGLFRSAGSVVDKVELNYDSMTKDTSADSEKTNIYADAINEIYAAIRKEEQNIWKQYVNARETFGDDDPTTRRFANGWSAIYDLMHHLEMI